jgi:hypothetical protein
MKCLKTLAICCKKGGDGHIESRFDEVRSTQKYLVVNSHVWYSLIVGPVAQMQIPITRARLGSKEHDLVGDKSDTLYGNVFLRPITSEPTQRRSVPNTLD